MNHNLKEKRPVIAIVLVLAIAVGVYLWQGASASSLKGRVEQEIVPHYSQVSGLIAELQVQSGQVVAEGDVLAVIDNTQNQYAIAQQEQIVIQKQAALDQLLTGADAATVAQARSQVQIAQAGYDTAQLAYESAAQDLERAKALFELGGLSQQEYDKLAQAAQTAANNVTAAAGQVEAAQQQVIVLSGASDKNAVKSAQAALAQAESQLAQLKDAAEDYTIRANCTGTVISVNYTKGALIAAGSDIADITDTAQTYVLAYVPVDALDTVTYGQPASIIAGDTTYAATVYFIDVKAQYTPKEFQTAIQREQESVKIKLQPEENTTLNPAQEVKVELQ